MTLRQVEYKDLRIGHCSTVADCWDNFCWKLCVCQHVVHICQNGVCYHTRFLFCKKKQKNNGSVRATHHYIYCAHSGQSFNISHKIANTCPLPPLPPQTQSQTSKHVPSPHVQNSRVITLSDEYRHHSLHKADLPETTERIISFHPLLVANTFSNSQEVCELNQGK